MTGILGCRADENVKVAGHSGDSVQCQGMSTHNHVLNAVRVQQLEQFFEVGLTLHNGFALGTPPLQFVPWLVDSANNPARKS